MDRRKRVDAILAIDLHDPILVDRPDDWKIAGFLVAIGALELENESGNHELLDGALVKLQARCRVADTVLDMSRGRIGDVAMVSRGGEIAGFGHGPTSTAT